MSQEDNILPGALENAQRSKNAIDFLGEKAEEIQAKLAAGIISDEEVNKEIFLAIHKASAIMSPPDQ